VGCTRFRYGQCNRHIACVGPIVCRVVACTPPWIFDAGCAPTPVLTDNNTRFHDRPCLHQRPISPLEDDMLIFAQPGKQAFLLAGDQAAPIKSASDYNNLVRVGVPVVALTAATYNDWIARFTSEKG
jgi:hypothetical protein